MSGPRGDISALAARSIEVIREHQAPNGAYIASPSLPTYRYSWLRDGTFIADAMSRVGETESADAFFGWCADRVRERRARVERLVAQAAAGEPAARDEHLHCRYTVDGREFEGEWSSYQLDGYGSWLWALGAHAERHGVSVEPWADAVALSARYVAAYWREPCFDWWEERWGRHTATLGSLHGGLAAAARLDGLPEEVREEAAGAAREISATVRTEAAIDGRLGGELDSPRLDASLLACATPFRALEPVDPLMHATVVALEAEIAHGGVHRYPGDTYYGGGEWLLLAAFLGWWYSEVGRRDEARAQLEWVAARATPDGDLPEQVAEHVLSPEGLVEWERRWGPSPSPLLWSHAMFLTLAHELDLA
jgi:isomaltose glucohydrolase